MRLIVLSNTPLTQFSLLLGTDTYRDIRRGKWHKSEELMSMVSFVVVDRKSLRGRCTSVHMLDMAVWFVLERLPVG